jgi:hypothetical protein
MPAKLRRAAVGNCDDSGTRVRIFVQIVTVPPAAVHAQGVTMRARELAIIALMAARIISLLSTQIVVSPQAWAQMGLWCTAAAGLWLIAFQNCNDRFIAFEASGRQAIPGSSEALIAHCHALGFTLVDRLGSGFTLLARQDGSTPLKVQIESYSSPKGSYVRADVLWSGRRWYRYFFPGQAGDLSRDLSQWWQHYKATHTTA